MSAAECPEEHCKMFSSRRGGSGAVAGGGVGGGPGWRTGMGIRVKGMAEGELQNSPGFLCSLRHIGKIKPPSL